MIPIEAIITLIQYSYILVITNSACVIITYVMIYINIYKYIYIYIISVKVITQHAGYITFIKTEARGA